MFEGLQDHVRFQLSLKQPHVAGLVQISRHLPLVSSPDLLLACPQLQAIKIDMSLASKAKKINTRQTSAW